MALNELADGRLVEIEQAQVELIRIRVLPGGRMSRKNAALYLGREPKTLADWKMKGKGPPCHVRDGLCFYYQSDLDAYLKGDAQR